ERPDNGRHPERERDASHFAIVLGHNLDGAFAHSTIARCHETIETGSSSGSLAAFAPQLLSPLTNCREGGTRTREVPRSQAECPRRRTTSRNGRVVNRAHSMP